MVVPLRISHLTNRLRCAGSEDSSAISAMVNKVSAGPLRQGLTGVAERALSRAGLPTDSIVAVRHLALRLQLNEAITDDDLIDGWSGALETALAQALAQARLWGGGSAGAANRPTDAEADSEPVVCFGDIWEAERQHLRRLAQGRGPAWWGDGLLEKDGTPLDVAPAAILGRWLERHPARGAAWMAELAGSVPAVALLLSPARAAAIAGVLARRFSARPDGEAGEPHPGTPLRALLERVLALLQGHPMRAAIARGAMEPAQARPWLLAEAIAKEPGLSLLSPAALLVQAESLTREAPVADDASREQEPGDGLSAPSLGPSQGSLPLEDGHAPSTARVHAGGLLLLLRPWAMLDAALPPEPWPPCLGDLGLMALERLFQPLPPGERGVALERERPLLELLAPDRDWSEPIANAEVQHPRAACDLLDALITRIPQQVRFAPGATRQVYGKASAPLADAASHLLARVVLRPGLLRWDRWEAEIAWPLATADVALRRAGWDLDPGWVRQLGRVVRFRYGEEVP